jgi:ABC-type uncharacterized transport system permease subunit
MERQRNIEYIKHLLFDNKVVLMFVIICGFAYWASGMTTVIFFNEMAVRFGRETIIVLSLLIPVIAGMGLNFGIVLGAMSAQIGLFFVVLVGGSGVPGLLMTIAFTTPIAIVLGFLVGRLFNKMKGSEMVGGLVTNLFAEGLYQLFFLFFLGGIIPIAYARLMTPTGVGVVNAVNLDTSPTYMRHVLDNVPMLHALSIIFMAVLIYLVVIIGFRLWKKIPVTMKGENSLRRPVILAAILGAFYVASGFGGLLFQNAFTLWLFRDRLNALFAVQWGSLIMVLLVFVLIIRSKYKEGNLKAAIAPLVFMAVVTALFAITFYPPFRAGLGAVGAMLYTFIPFIGVLSIAFYAVLILVLGLVVYRKRKNLPIRLRGEGNILFPIILLVVFGGIYIANGFGGLAFQNAFTMSLFGNGLYAVSAVRWILLVILILTNVIFARKGLNDRARLPYKQLTYLAAVGFIFYFSFVTDVYIGLENLGLPVTTYLLIFGVCMAIKWFLNTRLGQNMRTVGQSRPIATAAGINVDRTRVLAMIISTVLASYGHVIMMQNIGTMFTHGGHRFIGTYAVAAILVGGATVTKASAKHAVLGVVLFHALFILAPLAGSNLTGNSMLGEYFRVFISYLVIAIALIMHAWQRIKKKGEEAPKDVAPIEPVVIQTSAPPGND